MTLLFDLWIRNHSDDLSNQLVKCIVSSRRIKDSSIHKEVIESFVDIKLDKRRYKKVSSSRSQDHTLIMTFEELLIWMKELPRSWKQCDLFFANGRIDHLRFIDELGTISYKSEKRQENNQSSLTQHNRTKTTPFQDGVLFHPFYHLGIQNKDGSVKNKERHKFQQVNAFLLLMEPLISSWMKKEVSSQKLHIFDMGCGKGYLTHAMAHYFSKLFPGRITVTGVDSRKEVIDAAKNAIEKDQVQSTQQIQFILSTIGNASYKEILDPNDSVAIVALHACNTATDVALIQAHEMRAKLFFIAPCCHNEFSELIPKKIAPYILSHAILHQRYAALVTDAFRTACMKALGWSVEAIEFIDPENTPKNTLLRGRYTGKKEPIDADVQKLLNDLEGAPLLFRTLFN